MGDTWQIGVQYPSIPYPLGGSGSAPQPPTLGQEGSSTFDKILQIIQTGAGVYSTIAQNQTIREQVRAQTAGRIYRDPVTGQTTSNLGYPASSITGGIGLSSPIVLIIILGVLLLALLRR